MREYIRLTIDEQGVALLVLDVANRPMNLLTPALVSDLEQAVARVAGDASIRGAVVTSAKSDFLAGADLKELAGVFDAGAGRDALLSSARSFSTLYRRLETCGKPFVAAINGTALGGGLELCLACHHRVAVRDPAAKLGLPEVRIGLLPGAGGTQRLPRLIGIEAALPLMVEGTHLDPMRARELGIVDELVEGAGELVAAARRWILAGGEGIQPWDRKGFRVPGGTPSELARLFMAGTALIAAKTWRNYPAPRAILSCVYEGSQLPMDAALDVESQYFVELLSGPVARNMIRTLFIAKGAADRLKARPAGVPSRPVEKLGVIGAGMMGAGIAEVAARAGIEVVLLDRSADEAEKGRAGIAARLAQGAAGDAVQAVMDRVHAGEDFAALAGCELVVEAVFEDRATKADVTRRAAAAAGPDALLASNTSTLPIAGLADAAPDAARFIGIHFFSPVAKMPLVEIIRAPQTGQAAVAHAMDFVRQLGKTPIVVRDGRGFFTSRVFSTSVKEGLAMLAEGVAPALIENAARLAGLPVGPLAVSDELGIDLQYRILAQTRADLGADYRAHPADAVIERFHGEFGRKGRRHGAGFYDYPAAGRKHLWPGLADVFPPALPQPDVEEVRQRLLYVQSLEAARCLEESIVADAADADLASVLGWGFPAWTGGVLSLVETVGAERFIEHCRRLEARHGERFAVPQWLTHARHIRQEGT